MAERQWFDKTQPQTLQIAVFLLYFNAVLALIGVLFGGLWWPLLLGLAEGPIGFYIANESRLAYRFGVGVAGVLAAFSVVGFVIAIGTLGALISLLFAVALFALLVHPMSREYERTWFK